LWTFLGGLIKFFVFWLAYLFLFGFGLWFLNRGALAVFSHGFKVGIHSFTLPILISTTLGIAGVSVPIPGWFVVVHTLFALFVLNRMQKTGSQIVTIGP
jgi:ribose/xylose/arabinose/galactoside ABC-type transport system permease subunit